MTRFFRRTHTLAAAALALLGGFAPDVLAAQMPMPELRPGQSVEGQIEDGDDEMQDGSFYDAYEFQGSAGERVTITLRSADFDTYLHLMSGETRIAQDDDSAGGTDSRISVTLPRAGRYMVVANSLEKGKTGAYTLVMESSASGAANPNVQNQATVPTEPARTAPTAIQSDRESPAGQSRTAGFRPGQRVEVRAGAWRTPPRLDPGDQWESGLVTIVEVGSDKHLVRWDDNLSPKWVDATWIRPKAGATQAPAMQVGQRVQALSSGIGSMVEPATIVEVGQGEEAGLYRVRLEESGRVEWRNPYGGIQPIAPSRPVALPRTLPTGEYQCFASNATAFDIEAGSTWMGSFVVTGPSSYRFLTGTKLTGEYRYDPANGQITWLSGSLDGRQFRGEFRPAEGDRRANLRLHFRSPQGRESTQNCRKIR